MQVTLPSIDRSKLSPQWLSEFKGKHLFALVMEVGSAEHQRTVGIVNGQLNWLYRSAAQAHQAFKYNSPGEWHNHGLGEKVIAVTLIREDGKTWSK
jgi:hypothetical protein